MVSNIIKMVRPSPIEVRGSRTGNRSCRQCNFNYLVLRKNSPTIRIMTVGYFVLHIPRVNGYSENKGSVAARISRLTWRSRF